MAFLDYDKSSVEPGLSAVFEQLYFQSVQTGAVMTGLSSYWNEKYANSNAEVTGLTGREAIAQASAGYMSALSGARTRLLETILRANINDAPVNERQPLELLSFAENDCEINESAGTITFTGTGVQDIEYLTSQLFESDVVLVRGTHFTVDAASGTVTFLVDIFNDGDIFDNTFRVGVYPNRQVLLWGWNVTVSSTHLYDRYGRFLYGRQPDSMHYKWMVTALMYYYANQKSLTDMEAVLNILYGAAFALHDGEVVQSIETVGDDNESDYSVKITTDEREYISHGFAEPQVKVGDTLKQYQLLTKMNTVDDWITLEANPERFITGDTSGMSHEELVHKAYEYWHVPSELTDGEVPVDTAVALMENVLKYNMLFIRVTVSLLTYNSFLAQEAEIRKLVQSGIPVYLFPLLTVQIVDRMFDKVDSDDEFAFVDTYGIEDHAFTEDNLYNGERMYNGDACLYHGKDSLPHRVYYDGEHSYNDQRVHSWWWSPEQHYDGTYNYGVCFNSFHNGGRDIFRMDTIGFTMEDKFEFSDASKDFSTPIFYDGRYVHEGGGLRYGNSAVVMPEMEHHLTFTFVEESPIDDDFAVSEGTLGMLRALRRRAVI